MVGGGGSGCSTAVVLTVMVSSSGLGRGVGGGRSAVRNRRGGLLGHGVGRSIGRDWSVGRSVGRSVGLRRVHMEDDHEGDEGDSILERERERGEERRGERKWGFETRREKGMDDQNNQQQFSHNLEREKGKGSICVGA